MFARTLRGSVRDPMPDHRAVFEAIVRSDGEEARARMAKLVANAYGDTGLV